MKKQVATAHVGTLPVVVSRPFDGDFWYESLNASRPSDWIEKHYEAYFRVERHRLRLLASDFTPAFYGGCWASFRSTVHVGEYLRGYMDATMDQKVSFAARVRIAYNSVRMLQLWDSFPSEKNTLVRAVYGDFHAKQFALDASYRVKVVDIQSFFEYEPSRRYGDDFSCRVDNECGDKMWHAPAVMRGLRVLDLEDFSCDTKHGRCVGLGTDTSLAAVCALLLEPLFAMSPKGTSATDKGKVHRILEDCWTPRRSARSSVSDVLDALRRLLPSHLLNDMPPLPIENANLHKYREIKDAFEEVRKDRMKYIANKLHK